jgi:hypothetical protein
MNHVDHEHERCATTLTRFSGLRLPAGNLGTPQLASIIFWPRKREREYRAAGPQKSGLSARGIGSTS